MALAFILALLSVSKSAENRPFSLSVRIFLFPIFRAAAKGFGCFIIIFYSFTAYIMLFDIRAFHFSRKLYETVKCPFFLSGLLTDSLLRHVSLFSGVSLNSIAVYD